MKFNARLFVTMFALPVVVSTVNVAHAAGDYTERSNAGCTNDSSAKSGYECSGTIIGEPRRPYHAPPQQPAGEAKPGACGLLPALYQVRTNGATCGSATLGGSRFPEKVSPEKRDMWQRYLTAGIADMAQEERKNTNIGWQGTVNVPVTESYSWTELVGDYSNPEYCHPRDPMESLPTTCTIPREEIYWKDVEEEDRSVCEAYYPEPEPVSPSSGGGGGGSYSPGSSSPGSSSPSAPSIERDNDRGGGESASDLDDDYGMNECAPKTIDRYPAAECKTYGKKKVNRRFTRPANPYTYSCYKSVAKYCVHPVTRTTERACRPQPVTYSVRYVIPADWKPGYKDPKHPHRNYDHHLPNRFDLLVGEDERMVLNVNTSGRSTTLTPKVDLKSLWNEYYVKIDKGSKLQCANGIQPVVKMNIHTIGRLKRKAPNALTVPYRVVNVNGKQVKLSTAFTYEQETLKSGKVANVRPNVLTVHDQSRTLMLDASLLSRIYGRTESANHKETMVPTETISTAANGGFWVDTQYRVQMFYKRDNGNLVRVTGPQSVNQNQVRYNEDQLSIDLAGKDAVKKFYRPAGLFDGIMGGVYKHFGVEITPGRRYLWRVQMVTRGFPWYEQGCKGNKTYCEGEEASSKAFSEPLFVDWTAPKDVDRRSIVKRLIDFQEWLAPY